jgi:transcriptional regulator with XRE-family HTH domain
MKDVEIAKKSGIDGTTINRLGNGKRLPSTEQLGVLAQVLGCTINDLVPPGFGVPSPKPIPPTDIAFRVGTREQAAAFDPLDPTPGAPWINALLGDVPNARRLQPGLDTFLEENKDEITLSEALQLASWASSPMPGKPAKKDGDYWRDLLEFFRKQAKR